MKKVDEAYFISLCLKLFEGDLIYVINTDSYIRQPCYSSRAKDFYYLILQNSDLDTIRKVKYIQSEFKEFYINYLTYNVKL